MTLSAKTTRNDDCVGRQAVSRAPRLFDSVRHRPAVAIASSIALLAAGHFAWAALQGGTATSDLPGGDNHTRSIAVGDLNCDTFPDVIVANEDGQADQILWGNGDGTFQNPIDLMDVPNTVFMDDSDSVDLADIDQDGDLDILIGSGQSAVPNRLYENVDNCSGTFNYLGANAIGSTFGPRRSADARFGDLNGDGDPDVVVANRGTGNVAFLGGPGTGFPVSDNLPNSGSTDSSSIAIGDLNGDGRPEVVIGNRENARNDVYINNGNTNIVPFSNRFDLSPDANYTDWVVIADLNNDGWNDVVIANREQPNQFLLNNQSGVNTDLFGPTQQINGDADYTRELRVVDVDNDGDLDVITANDSSAFNKVYLNQFVQSGAVVFSSGIAYTPDMLESTSLDVCDPNATPACDLDGDGDIDAVSANNANQLQGVTTAPNQVHLNGNEAPAIISLPIEGASVGNLYEYTIVAADADFDQALTVTAVTAPAWLSSLTPDPNDDRRATASGTPTAEGAFPVSITVSDGTESATQDFTIIVVSAAPPTLNAIADPLGVTQGQSFDPSAIVFSASGGSAPLALSAPIAPSWFNLIDNGDGTANIDGNAGPSQNDIGSYPLTIRVTDANNQVDEQSLTISVADGNDRPVGGDDLICIQNPGDTVTALADIHPYYGATTLFWNDSDPDGDIIDLADTNSVPVPPTGGTLDFLNADGTFSYTHDGVSPQDTFRYRINDNNGGFNRADVRIRLSTDALCQEDNNAAPVITVDPVDVEINQGDAWDDAAALAGVTASDNEDGDITANIVLNNPVDPNTPGDYLVTFDVTDSQGKAAQQAIRNVTVVTTDTTPPVITLTGAAVIDLIEGDTYVEEGATATDDVDGDISANIVIGGDVVDTATPGTYVVTYNVSDAAGNAAVEVTRTVNVAADEAPVITLLGDAVINLAVGDTYTDPGATATDDVDGDISNQIVVGGDTVDTDTVGTYVVTYNVTDSAGNPATEVTRTINVSQSPDTTPPVITLIGDAVINLVVGDAYIEEGATATDDRDGDISSNIVIDNGAVDTSTAGTYIVTYTVSDSSGNQTEETRTVNVTMGQPPVITVLGTNPVTVTQGSAYTDAGAEATDPEDGNLTANIVTNNPVNTSVAGSYTVTYTVTDSAGNTASATRTVRVQSSGGGNTGGGGGGGSTSLAELLVMMLLFTIVVTGRRLRPHRRST